MNPFERIFTVLYSPVSAFEDALKSPKLIVPIILFTLLTTGYLSFYFFNCDIAVVFDKQIEQSGKAEQLEKIPEGQRDNIIAMQHKFMKYGGSFAALITIPLWFAGIALYFWIVAKILGTEQSFSQCMTIPVYSYSVSAVALVIGFVILLSSDFSTTLLQDLIPSNVGYFVDTENMSLASITLLKALDFFAFWKLIVTGIGASVVLRTSPLVSGLLVFVPWILMIAGSIFFATL